MLGLLGPGAHPWAQALAKKNGQVAKGGLIFGQGISEQTADEFLSLRQQAGGGNLTAGQQYGNGKYVVTGGNPLASNWASFSPGDNYERITYDQGVNGIPTAPKNGGWMNHQFDRPSAMVWRRKDAPAPAPAPTPPVAPKPPAPPKPSAPGVDVAGPSLADALGEQRRSADRPRLQDALNSALRINEREPMDWSRAGADESAGRFSDQRQEDGEEGMRYAASDRWRRRLADVQDRIKGGSMSSVA